MARNLKESSINPEDLMHSSYREHVVKYLVGLVSVQESVVVIAERGYGLSRLLRFITYGHYPVKPIAEIQLIYLNMLDFTATSASSFISHLNQYLDKKKKEESLCFVIDELNLDEQTETYFKLLTGFRGKDRTHISFIVGISINTQNDFDIKTPPNYIEDLVGTSIFRLPPLSQSDFYKVAEEMISRFGLIMTRKEIEGLYIKTKGVPSELRFTLQDKFREKFLGETEQTEVTGYQLQLESGHIMCGQERIDLELTKAEEGFLKIIIEKRGEVVHRDELGAVLSPESDGTGVSNESIDQLIYRLRKKLIKLGCKEKIETYTGRGYGLMG